MPMREQEARDLAKDLQKLIFRFQYLGNGMSPPDSEFSFRELRVLLFVGYNQPCIMKDIADRLGIPVSTATGIIDRMVEKELVYRERPEDDRRIVKVALTEKGNEVYEWGFEEHFRFVRDFIGGLDDNDRKVFITIMRKIANVPLSHERS